MKENSVLPLNWRWVKLAEIAKWGSGGTPLSTNPAYYHGSIPWVIIGDLNDGFITQTEKHISQLGLKNSSAKLVPANTVLVAMYGSIGKLGINKIPVATNQAIAFAEKLFDSTYNMYLFYFLLFSRSKLHSLGKGGTQKNISQAVLKAIDFPLPPIEQQKTIVSKIESLFSELDKAVEKLKEAHEQLKTYKQSVLKWAFEGRLTNENVKEGELPEGWRVVELGDLMESVRNGYSKKPDDSGKVKILRISSVRPNKINFEDVRFLKTPLNESDQIQENDLLFTRYNGSIDFVGVCGVVPPISERIFYPDKLIRCRPLIRNRFHSIYIQYSANFGKARKHILSKIKTTAGQTGIAGNEIKTTPITIAPLEEQIRIVQVVESRMSVADKMEEGITESLQQAEALRQSILKRAFEGKLV